MNISQQDRHNLFTQLQSALGDPAAGNLMELLPLQPNSELVTRADMASLRDALRGEMAELRGELKGDMAELRADMRSEMGELRVEMRSEMGELRADMRSEMGELRVELKADMAGLDGRLSLEMGRLYRWGAAVVAANTVTTLTVLIAG